MVIDLFELVALALCCVGDGYFKSVVKFPGGAGFGFGVAGNGLGADEVGNVVGVTEGVFAGGLDDGCLILEDGGGSDWPDSVSTQTRIVPNRMVDIRLTITLEDTAGGRVPC